MTKKEFEQLRKIFFSKLERKTGWGKEEVKKLWLEAITDFLIAQNELINNYPFYEQEKRPPQGTRL